MNYLNAFPNGTMELMKQANGLIGILNRLQAFASTITNLMLKEDGI